MARHLLARDGQMNALTTVEREHRLIERVTAALDSYAYGLSRGEGDPSVLGAFVEFFKYFVGAVHHAREDEIIFPALIACGLPERHGPVAQMRLEHETAGRFLEAMETLAKHSASWSDEQRRDVVETCRAYVHVLRLHMAKEDDVVLPYARARLRPQELEDIDQRFEDFEQGEELAVFERADDLANAVIVRATRLAERPPSNRCPG